MLLLEGNLFKFEGKFTACLKPCTEKFSLQNLPFFILPFISLPPIFTALLFGSGPKTHDSTHIGSVDPECNVVSVIRGKTHIHLSGTDTLIINDTFYHSWRNNISHISARIEFEFDFKWKVFCRVQKVNLRFITTYLFAPGL